MIRQFRRAAIAALIATLSACGGGGSSTAPASSASDAGKGTGTSTSPTVTAQSTVETHTGMATYYTAIDNGACLLDVPADRLVTALSPADFNGSASCGDLLHVTGPKGSVTVQVIDRCPECVADHLDLSAEAFARIADPVAGVVNITWQPVAGVQTSPVQYRYKEGSSAAWVGIQVRNHRLPITRLEIQTDASGASGTWVNAPRMDYNYFVHPQAVAEGPLRVRITSSTGSQLIDTLPAPQGGLLVTGQAQFP